MALEILCVEPIYIQYSGFLKTCLALRYWFFEVLGSESVKQLQFCAQKLSLSAPKLRHVDIGQKWSKKLPFKIT